MKTTLHTVLCIVIRVGAVLMFAGVIEQLPVIFLARSQDRDFSAGALWLAGAGALLAFVLWVWPNVLAWWASSRRQHEILESPISADQMQRIALSIIGIWLFISGVTGLLARAVMVFVVFRRLEDVGQTKAITALDWYWLVEHLATAILGACLALSSRGLVGLLRRMRDYPHAAIINADPDTATTRDG